ncbi:MAG TPA: hypothetical protein VMT85_13505 [Thermoanaerobaculia bacterium]|nr:hypothetical protein [Thermoanaerobaculia bacterium]
MLKPGEAGHRAVRVDFDSVLTAADVDRALDVLLGDAGDREVGGGSARSSCGVLHVVATWRDPAGMHRVLRIERRTPKSDHDSFLLNAARARAEGIVTTGAILRAEPGIRWSLAGPGRSAIALEEWRHRRWRETRPPGAVSPWLAVLSSGLDLDLDHPGLREGVSPLLVTGIAGERHLGEAARARGIEVASSGEPGLVAALDALRRRGATRITVEAGPSTARALYRDPRLRELEELWLSTFLGTPPEEVVGSPLVSEEDLRAWLEPCSPPRVAEEPSGGWQFQRFVRTARGAGRSAGDVPSGSLPPPVSSRDEP